MSQSTCALKINKVNVRARAQQKDKATTAEVRSLRECNGAVQWLAKESRPDLAVQVSLSQQALSDPRVRHCRQANAMVRRAKRHRELMWRFLSVPLENLRLVIHSDAAFQNAQGGASQAGYIIAVTDDRLARGELAPWSPLIWRSHKMRRIVGSTLAAETQSLLNGLGHVEWIAAHFAEARFPNFDVAQRSIFLRNFRLQCVVDAKSLYDHLISLSSLSSVEDKRCGFDLVISRQCMQRLGATIRWAPTNRQLADAFKKASADPVDLLRSCMRSGEYQLSLEHIILERAAAERSRRKPRQTSSQSSSPQSEPSVSSNAFMVQSGICLKRTEPVNTVCVMVVFPSLGNELQMRSFLESLDSEHASSATSVKVKVPAKLVDNISFEESAATQTLTWSKKPLKVQVQGPLTMLDRAKEQLIKLLQTCRTNCESRKVLPPPNCGERAASMLRCPARSDYLVSVENGSGSNRRRATFVPQHPTFGAIVEQITAEFSKR